MLFSKIIRCFIPLLSVWAIAVSVGSAATAGQRSVDGFVVLPLPGDAVIVGCSADMKRFCGYRTTTSPEVSELNQNGANIVKYRARTDTTTYIWSEDGRVIDVIDGNGKLDTYPKAISSDGTTVVGGFCERRGLAGGVFRWRHETGLTRIFLGDVYSSSSEVFVSSDGSTVAASGRFGIPNSGIKEDLIWRESGVAKVKPCDRTHTIVSLLGISGNGKSVLCRGAIPDTSSFTPGVFQVFRWSEENGHFPLPKPMTKGNFYGRDPYLISEDGSTVVGAFIYGKPGPFNFDWCAWTTSGSMIRIVPPSEWPRRSLDINVVSADGQLIGGECAGGYGKDIVYYYRKNPRTGSYVYHKLRPEWKKKGYPISGLGLFQIIRFSSDNSKALCRAKDSQGRNHYLIGSIDR